VSGHAAEPRDLLSGITSDAVGEKRFISVVGSTTESD
jgi:hypothetical protein